jgi:integrase
MREVARYALHALRHACASLWIEQGHNPKQIPTLMGHSSIKVTPTCSPIVKPISAPPRASNFDYLDCNRALPLLLEIT